mmetsp:Transcript_97650/g.275021  ORF Transcript_97650/g.275021 Transcript_97650/m.275021 type:complete len:95 (+) Transcript_97650:534-818(+)
MDDLAFHASTDLSISSHESVVSRASGKWKAVQWPCRQPGMECGVPLRGAVFVFYMQCIGHIDPNIGVKLHKLSKSFVLGNSKHDLSSTQRVLQP